MYLENEGGHNCHYCHPGSYADQEGMALCTPCEVMHYQPAAGKTDCKKCPEDLQLTITGAVSCHNNCQPGTVSPHNDNHCEKCRPGTYQPGGGAMSCIECRVGEYQSASGEVKCIRAEPGTPFCNRI